jgi:RNA polymerase sigma-70 factor (ECF subfamily)
MDGTMVLKLTVAGLVDRIRRGDRTGEEDLVRQYSRGVLIILGRSVTDRSLVDDLYQECFRLILIKVRTGEVREPERLSGFICGVARHIVIEHFRKVSRREKHHTGDFGRDFAACGPSQLDDLLRRERARLARRILAELPSARDREVLYRFYIAEQDRESICADLGIASAHLNQILCRARQRYKAMFTQALQNWSCRHAA